MSRLLPALAVVLLLSLPALSRAADFTSAEWIWTGEDGSADTWVCFRKTFAVSSVPATAVAAIAVDSKYWMWVNGELAVFEGGLKRGPTPEGTWYDEVDLAPFLRTGPNTIAVLVWYWGRDGFSHHDSGKGGLILEAQLGSDLLTTDATWRCRPHPAYESAGPPHPNWALSERNVRFDARNDSVRGWTDPGFEDVDWGAAIPQGVAGSAPWNALTARPIPQWKDSGLLPYVNDAEIPDHGGAVVVAQLPYNAQVTPYLEVDAPAGLLIDIRSDQYYGGGPANVRAEYVTRDGVQEFEALGWMNGHAIEYSVPAGVEILNLGYRETGFDTEFAGSFASDDPFCDSLWRKAQRTLYVCMRDNVFDCPDRERAQYWGDVVSSLGQTAYALDPGAHALFRKAILDLVRWQRPDDTLFAPVPTGVWDQEIPVQMLASVGRYGIAAYYRDTGDLATIQAAYPSVRAYLLLWETGPDGLVVHRPGDWDWLDWGVDPDALVLENAWYSLALEAAIDLAGWTGHAGDVAVWQARRAGIASGFDAAFWTGSAYSSPGQPAPDDRANAMAVVAGLAGPDKWPALRTVLRDHQRASPWMENWVLEALFRMGYANDAFNRMRSRYAGMVASPLTTLWEHWTVGSWTSTNHAWAGGPLRILSGYAAGVAVEDVAWSSYHVLPQVGDLTSVDVTVPTPRGAVIVSLERTENEFRLDLESPTSTSARVGIPKASFLDETSVLDVVAVGSVVVWDGSYLGGVPGLSFRGETERWVEFDVEPGAWSFLGVGVSDVTAVPPSLHSPTLAPPRPNPATHGTALHFTLPASVPVELAVHDVAGRRIRGLIRETLAEGTHRIVWDGRGERGGAVPSGIYFVRLRAGDERRVVRVTVLR